MIKKDKAGFNKRKKIWIDLDNSPHVPFFKPIIEELLKRGYDVLLTARACFQVCELADMYEMEYLRIGHHYGKIKVMKIFGTFIRGFQLISIVKKEKPHLSISHGSRSLMISSTLLKIPIITIVDYEYAMILPFVKQAMIVVPEVVSARSFGEKRENIVFKYPGIKEDVYAPLFKPDPYILTQLGLRNTDLVVTIRPPATEAHYHNPESEKLFIAVVEFLLQNHNVRLVILPRNEIKQTAWIRNMWSEMCKTGKIIIPDHAVNGLNLIWHSDLVVSGGGTMNREAAALGVPVYSIFRGKVGAVDRYLSDNGRLTLLESVEDVKTKVKIIPRNKYIKFQNKNSNALQVIVGHLIEILNNV